MSVTTIEWTAQFDSDGKLIAPGYTYNPWWGCTKVSAGCTNCYADTLAARYGHNVWGPKADRRFFGQKHWDEPKKWDKAAAAVGVRARVFCASMADVFERHMRPNIQSQMNLERARLWEVIDQTPNLDWLLLTKRPEHIREMIPVRWLHEVPQNVWYGTSTEDQEQANKRIPELLKVPAVVRFLSCEPLLGPVDLTDIHYTGVLRDVSPGVDLPFDVRLNVLNGQWHDGWDSGVDQRRIHWVIAGGESGNGYRPLNLDWARSLRDQCQSANVAYFFKQVGGRIAKSGGRTLDNRLWSEFPQ